MFVMMTSQHDDSDCTLRTSFWLDVSFASFFLLEAILKLVALGARWYFADVWNVFDFIVVASSIFSATIDYISGHHSCPIEVQAQSQYFESIGQIVGFFKIIRVLRILRLLRLLKGVRRMLDSLITSLPSLASVASLLLLLIGIFAVLSASFFSNVCSKSRELLRNGFGGSESHNYQNFYNSFRMLFRFLTGEAWPSTMSDAMQV